MAPGGGRERKEINIFLIKTQFYKYLFHLMLQELNITFLFLGCQLAGWQRQRQAQEREIFSSSEERIAQRRNQIQKVQTSELHPHQHPPSKLEMRNYLHRGSGTSDVTNKSPFSLNSASEAEVENVAILFAIPNTHLHGLYLPPEKLPQMIFTNRHWSPFWVPAGAAFRKPPHILRKRKGIGRCKPRQL